MLHLRFDYQILLKMRYRKLNFICVPPTLSTE